MNATGRLRRCLLSLAALLLLWAATIALSGGLVLDLGASRISSRNTVNPLLLALVAIGAAVALAPSGLRRQTLVADWQALMAPLTSRTARITSARWRWLATAGAALLAVAIVALGLLRGALVAGGADSYGYVSQAHLWSTGTLRMEQAWLDDPPGGIQAEALVPLAYRLSPDRRTIVPVFPPGLPMVMGLVERVGGRQAPFAVMPLLAGLTVWLTFLLGKNLAGPHTGVGAALLLATSPAFVFQLTHAPMSDIPAAAWWTAALLLVGQTSRRSAFVAGLAVAAGVLTRPNLVPLALVPAAVLAWEACSPAHRRVGLQRLLLFAAGSIPGALTVAALNAFWYGSPTASGYGSLAGTFYRLEHLTANLARYPSWLLSSQGVLIVAAAAAPFLLWPHASRAADGRQRIRILSTTSAVVVVFLCYVFYLPFDVWWFLRFLLPAFPALFALVAAGLVYAAARLAPAYRASAAAALIAAMTAHGVGFGHSHDAYRSGSEWRYAAAGAHVNRALPERAVLFSMLHSGSLRYYANRLTVRYDLVSAEEFTAAAADLRARGYVPYLLLDPGEMPEFTTRFAGNAMSAIVDRPPLAVVDDVRLYELPPP